MKTNELMIGDWVTIPYDLGGKTRKPLQVFILEERKSYNEIEPIPLTVDFLKKNGFDFDELEGYWYFNDYVTPMHNWLEDDYDRNVIFRVNGNDFNLGIAGCGKELVDINIRYVHEYQHALRLTGLSVIADGLKIE